MIDLYYFKIVHYRVKQVIQPIPIYKTSRTWDYKFYYNKEIQKGNYANDQIVVGGSCGDDGSAVEVRMLGMDASVSPIVGSSGCIVCSGRGGAYDGSMGSYGIGMACSGVDRIPKWCCICLRMVVCWVWVAITCS